jgi:Putative amidoligase enzyme
MKTQKFGVEIEMTGITRAQAAEVALQYFGSTARREHLGGRSDDYRVVAADGRAWKFVYDGSIVPKRKERRQVVAASSEYSVEMVSPILTYDDIERVQELVRRLRARGALSESQYRCGIHVHCGAERHTPTSLKNLVNLVASKEELLYKSLEIDPARLQYCKKVNERLIATINQVRPQTLQALADVWYGGASQAARNQHYHESRYAGLNLHSVFEKGTVEFRLFNGTLHAGKIRAYLVLCLAINHQALRQKTARFSRSQTDNEKYGLRVWLETIQNRVLVMPLCLFQ